MLTWVQWMVVNNNEMVFPHKQTFYNVKIRTKMVLNLFGQLYNLHFSIKTSVTFPNLCLCQ